MSEVEYSSPLASQDGLDPNLVIRDCLDRIQSLVLSFNCLTELDPPYGFDEWDHIHYMDNIFDMAGVAQGALNHINEVDRKNKTEGKI